MNSEKVLKTVERLLQKSLSHIERRVLLLSWEGQSYKDIEKSTGYVIGYLRDVGSGLWKELSEILNQRVTKKNLSLILERLENDYASAYPSDRNLARSPDVKLQADITNHKQETIDPSEALSFPSAPVPFNSCFYIKRPPCEELAFAEIARQGCLLRIKAPQKMGKSSLLNQIIAHADSLDYQIAYLDFKDAEETVFTSIEPLLQWFCISVSQQLGLPHNLNYYWDEDIGYKISCKIFLENHILENTKRPLVLAINELNRVFEHPQTAVDFLPLLRSFHEQSRRSKAWQKLRLVLVYSTEIYVPCKIDRSPFNVGLFLKLPQFNEVQILELAGRYGLNWQIEKQVRQLMSLVGGHPYLVNIALYFLSQEIIEMEQLLLDATTPTGIYAQHLHSCLILLQQNSQLLSAMYEVINSNEPVKIDSLVAYKLASIGLIALDGFLAKPNCELYRLYFREVLQAKNTKMN
ncbi:AAA-like domain-containing protein [Myxosarcina sp. GI1]|uniref:AAA-like domain-containing protein n=1 Tax=Myxosarcina sp. GI1 TaxID=1541065 RepID=UPI000565079D|nr:AAA-like domain-containing protein [Myxosarcina sp. GI1]